VTSPAVIILGVATHKDLHVAVTLDALGRRLGIASFPTDDQGDCR